MKCIQLPHKVLGKTCMINGLEDLYEWKMGQRLPGKFLIYMSGFAGFVYLKNKNAPAPRMVLWGPRAVNQYELLAKVMDFTWSMTENRSFDFTLKQAKACIDAGTPIIIGALDMYHLPYYPKFYHTIHVPIHYVLMVGYDDVRQVALVQDCDRADVQDVPYTDLESAWNVAMPGYSKKNTFFAFDLDNDLPGIEAIARGALREKIDWMLHPPTSMFGITGLRKLAAEIQSWPDTLPAAQADASLRFLVEYTGNPPLAPSRLIGFTYQDIQENHAGGRDEFADILRWLAVDYNEPAWGDAAELFTQSAQAVEEMTTAAVDYILGDCNTLEPAATSISRVADIEEQAYRLLDTVAERETA